MSRQRHKLRRTKKAPVVRITTPKLIGPRKSLHLPKYPLYSAPEVSIQGQSKSDWFADQTYLARMGFIRSQESADNPHNLPVGFATTDYINLPGTNGKKTAIGFNCAACHTGHFVKGDTEYVIEGGPATVNLGFFTKALGGVVQQVNDTWFKLNYISQQDIPYFEANIPNCLRAGNAYKARPLNGVWATAPFLHNGSIATLMDLLSPHQDRPKLVQLGSLAFDSEKVGIKQDPNLKMKPGKLYEKGIFILDTTEPGNLNTGHEFAEDYDPAKSWRKQRQGVIGPLLSDTERKAIIEYLKTI